MQGKTGPVTKPWPDFHGVPFPSRCPTPPLVSSGRWNEWLRGRPAPRHGWAAQCECAHESLAGLRMLWDATVQRLRRFGPGHVSSEQGRLSPRRWAWPIEDVKTWKPSRCQAAQAAFVVSSLSLTPDRSRVPRYLQAGQIRKSGIACVLATKQKRSRVNRASKTRQVLRHLVSETVLLDLMPLTVGACGWCRLGERHGARAATWRKVRLCPRRRG